MRFGFNLRKIRVTISQHYFLIFCFILNSTWVSMGLTETNIIFRLYQILIFVATRFIPFSPWDFAEKRFLEVKDPLSKRTKAAKSAFLSFLFQFKLLKFGHAHKAKFPLHSSSAFAGHLVGGSEFQPSWDDSSENDEKKNQILFFT